MGSGGIAIELAGSYHDSRASFSIIAGTNEIRKFGCRSVKISEIYVFLIIGINIETVLRFFLDRLCATLGHGNRRVLVECPFAWQSHKPATQARIRHRILASRAATGLKLQSKNTMSSR